mmetsp:Transcript_12623/g.28661  ORF Transcript_12623/g.28661 Transcript_12623/m.28661 type:complete len:307 (+) Transcript_12623:178-1098(+)
MIEDACFLSSSYSRRSTSSSSAEVASSRTASCGCISSSLQKAQRCCSPRDNTASQSAVESSSYRLKTSESCTFRAASKMASVFMDSGGSGNVSTRCSVPWGKYGSCGRKTEELQHRTCPRPLVHSPARLRRRVVFPLPDSPMTSRLLPGGTSKFKLLTSSSPDGNCSVRLLTETPSPPIDKGGSGSVDLHLVKASSKTSKRPPSAINEDTERNFRITTESAVKEALKAVIDCASVPKETSPRSHSLDTIASGINVEADLKKLRKPDRPVRHIIRLNSCLLRRSNRSCDSRASACSPLAKDKASAWS